LLVDIAEYVLSHEIESETAYETAYYCLMDSLACAFQALRNPACTRLLGPVVPGAVMPGGARVPGTSFELDPVTAAFNIGVMIRWLDFNDTWLAAEWGHPSDNLGGILAVADYLARRDAAHGKRGMTVRELLGAMIKAYEIQGVLALENSFNRVGLDHVLLVRVASAAVATAMLGGTQEQVINAVSNAWMDGGTLRAYRHAPNTGSRKGWAAGDATSRGVRLALLALAGEMGYPSALTAETWGFQDALFQGKALVCPQPFGSYVMENVLFKISYPAEFHAQTAVEAAITLHPRVRERLDDIERIVIETQEPALRIIDKTGPLANPADRDHCMQYMWRLHSSSVACERTIMRTRSRAIRASMRCAQRWSCAKTPTLRATTTRRISVISVTPCRCSSVTARRQNAWRSTIRSAIASAERRRFPCWWRSSSAL